jgi:hypothetical protein
VWRRLASSWMICAWIDTSSAESGGERAGDADALALTAGEFVGEAAGVGGIEADLGEQGGEPVGGVGQMVDGQAVGDLGTDAAARVEAAIGVLEDDLQAGSQAAPVGVAGAGHPLAVEQDGAGAGGQQAEQQAAEGGFAGAGFADHAECLAAGDADIDLAYCLNRGPAAEHAAAGEGFAEAGRLDQRGAHALAQRRQRTRRSGVAGSKGGAVAAQASIARAQRGAKLQPAGR